MTQDHQLPPDRALFREALKALCRERGAKSLVTQAIEALIVERDTALQRAEHDRRAVDALRELIAERDQDVKALQDDNFRLASAQVPMVGPAYAEYLRALFATRWAAKLAAAEQENARLRQLLTSGAEKLEALSGDLEEPPAQEPWNTICEVAGSMRAALSGGDQ